MAQMQLPELGTIRTEVSEYYDDDVASPATLRRDSPQPVQLPPPLHREEVDDSTEREKLHAVTTVTSSLQPSLSREWSDPRAPSIPAEVGSTRYRPSAIKLDSSDDMGPQSVLPSPSSHQRVSSSTPPPRAPSLHSMLDMSLSKLTPNATPQLGPLSPPNRLNPSFVKNNLERNPRYTLPFPVQVYNSQSARWHPSCFIQFCMKTDDQLRHSVQGFHLIDDRVDNAVVATVTRAWPYESDRMFFPMSAFTFLYNDDESKDELEQASRVRTFCGSLSAGLSSTSHPLDAKAFPALSSVPQDELVGFLYLPSLILPPAHASDSHGNVSQADDLAPWETVSGVPIVDPFQERPLFLRCPTSGQAQALHRKIVEAFQSYYNPIRPDFDETGRSRILKEDDAVFDRRTFYRHCIRRVFQMHFMRRILLLGAAKEASMFHTLWTQQPEDECMKQLIQSHSSTGTLSKLLTRIRTLVSLKKIRYMDEGFNLDLASITPNIVAMGFPSTGSQALMRNPMEDVIRYFELFWGTGVWPASKASIKAHLDKNSQGFAVLDEEAISKYLASTRQCRYRVYNLCSERCYPPSRFAGSFERFPSDDHNPPPLAQLFAFCHSAEAFLIGNDSKDPEHLGSALVGGERVVAIHCKAGKGRTGVMIVALMMFMKLFDSLDAALHCYNTKRTRDGKGITIASQIRFLKYFVHTLSQIGRALPSKRPVRLRAVSFSPIPWFDMDGGCTPYFQVRVRVENHCHNPIGQREVLSTEEDSMKVVYDSQYRNGVDGALVPLESYVGSERAALRIQQELELVDEVHFVFYNKGGRLLHTEQMFSFWLHTSFLDDRAAVVMLGRDEVDGASKEHREFFDPGFLVEVEYTALAPVPH